MTTDELVDDQLVYLKLCHSW